MTQQPATTEKRRVFRGDFLFACSMLFACCIFVGALIAAPFGEFKEHQKIVSANLTSTAFAVVTQKAGASATAIAHTTEQARYKFIDPFDNNNAYWLVEATNDEYMSGSIAISGGIYIWNIREVKQPFVYWSNFRAGTRVEDFDVYVDTQVKGSPGDACSGFVFRTASVDWEEGAYTFTVCNNSSFYISYYEQGKWETILESVYSASIRSDGWNRIEVGARGNDFRFLINNELIHEMTDDRQPIGGLGLYVEVNETNPVSVWFDNFGFQSR